MARSKTPERLSYVQNPAAGTLLAAPAGGQAEAEFDFYNDSPDVASFYLEVDGLGPDWVSGVGPAFEAYAAASGGGQLRVTLTPPVMATVGEYDFKVRVMSLGAPINDGTALVLRVDPPDEHALAQAASVAEEPVAQAPIEYSSLLSDSPPVTLSAPEPEPISEAVTPKPEPTVVVPEPEPIKPEPVVNITPTPAKPTPTALAPKPRPTPVQKTPPVTPTPREEQKPVLQIQQTPATVEPNPGPAEPQPAPRPVPQPTPRPAGSTQTPQPRPTPVAPDPPAPDEPVLVDYQPRGVGGGAGGHPLDDEEEEATPTEPFQLDPKDGTLIPLRPGETVLLRFPFLNDTPRERTFILDEDRALEDGWLTLVQDQVNLTRNGQGELSVRLQPPINADPGDYPFTITVGPQGGQILPRVFTLSVLATPAVQLATKDKTVKVGPFSSDIIFPLTVESLGNADTAFRVAVKAPQSETNDGQAPATGDIYDTPQWRYLFDKEMETLRSPMSGQQPRPVPIQLRVRRKGIWWFGFKEQHQLRVAAVPVTEPTNGGKAGNSLELTAVRSRILPFPILLLIPLILLIMLFLSGGAHDLSVADAQYSQGNAYWIVDPKGSDTKNIGLTWTAAPLALLRLSGAPQGQEDNPPINAVKFGSGVYQGSVPVSTAHRDVLYHYRVSRLLGGGDQDVLAHFIYTRGDTPLAVIDGNSHKALYGKDVTITVPASGVARLDIQNTTKQFNRLDWWLVKGLDDTSANKFRYIKSNGSMDPGQSEHFLIERNPGSSNTGSDEQIVLITTDATRPVLTVTLKSGQ